MSRGPSSTEIDEFDRIFDEDDFPAFASAYLKIQTKRHGLQPMALWPMQVDLWQRRKADDIRRSLTLKYRQGGFSIFEIALGFFRCLRNPDWNFLVMAHEKELPIEFLQRINVFIANVPEWFELKPERQSATEIYFQDQRSAMRIGSAAMLTEGAGAKIGRTVQHLHMTELSDPRWKDDAINMLLQTVPIGCEVYGESTAKGARGWFHEEYVAGKKGTGTFFPFFYEWWWQPEYRLHAPVALVPTDREAFLMSAHGLTPEQIAFRRHKVSELRSENKFLELYPEDDISCFLLSGSGFFDGAAIQRQVEAAQREDSPAGTRCRIRRIYDYRVSSEAPV
jgi:hypothetical protein